MKDTYNGFLQEIISFMKWKITALIFNTNLDFFFGLEKLT